MNKTENDPAVGCALERRVRVVVRTSEYPMHLPLEPAAWESWVVGKLKDAGIPVKGALIFSGIERGTLTRFDDPTNFDATIWEWNPNEKGEALPTEKQELKL